MQHEAMITSLKSIKLYGMAQAVDELAKQGSPAYQNAQEILGTLLKAEMAEREVRSIAYQTKGRNSLSIVTWPALTSARALQTKH